LYEAAEPLGLSGQSAGAPWALLGAELDRWADAGQTATLWWRDDDAGEMTAQLDRLLKLRENTGIALALAAVPTRVDASFRSRLAVEADVAVLQHGYSHHNFATPGERKIELDGSRPADHVIADLAVGMQSLGSLPGWLPVLVPPWNRIAAHLLPLLPELGYRGLSSLGPRQRPNVLAGLRQNNVHIDPIDWRGRNRPPRAFGGTDNALAAAIEHLAARRTGTVDGEEATGLMTHHLIQDENTWRFVEQFIAHTQAHPAVKWLAAGDIFERAE
jgi:hypothetical protein